MSIYSLYTGILYNEFFSMPMAIFGDTNFKCLAIDPYRNNRLVLNMTMAEEAYHHEPVSSEAAQAAGEGWVLAAGGMGRVAWGLGRGGSSLSN